jgi:hypothetical protein
MIFVSHSEENLPMEEEEEGLKDLEEDLQGKQSTTFIF